MGNSVKYVDPDGKKVYFAPGTSKQTKYKMNIIVGPLGKIGHLSIGENGTISVTNRQNGISIYNNFGALMTNLKLKVINNILKY